MARRELGRGRGRGRPGGLADEAGHGVGRLRALAEPVLHPFDIEYNVIALFQGLIGADFLDELPVTRTAIVRHHNAEHGVVLRTDSFHAYSHCHKSRISSGAAAIDTRRPASFFGYWFQKRGETIQAGWGWQVLFFHCPHHDSKGSASRATLIRRPSCQRILAYPCEKRVSQGTWYAPAFSQTRQSPGRTATGSSRRAIW